MSSAYITNGSCIRHSHSMLDLPGSNLTHGQIILKFSFYASWGSIRVRLSVVRVSIRVSIMINLVIIQKFHLRYACCSDCDWLAAG